MIAEHTAVYDLTSNPLTGFAVRADRHHSGIPAIVHRIADACARFVKAPVLPYAEVWAASLTADFVREREGRSRPDQYVVELECRTNAWLRR
jgi:hypothetical protein